MYYNFLKFQYLLGKITSAQLDNFVVLGKITAAQAEEIKGLGG
jgi:uncharacterized XkdX family phage protein